MKNYNVTYAVRIPELAEDGKINARQMRRVFNTRAKRALCQREIIARCKAHARPLKGYYVGFLGATEF